jgi:hypothetical protein
MRYWPFAFKFDRLGLVIVSHTQSIRLRIEDSALGTGGYPTAQLSTTSVDTKQFGMGFNSNSKTGTKVGDRSSALNRTPYKCDLQGEITVARHC